MKNIRNTQSVFQKMAKIPEVQNCRKCNESKHISMFYKETEFRHSKTCKCCHYELTRKNIISKNRDDILKYHKEYYKRHK